MFENVQYKDKYW